MTYVLNIVSPIETISVPAIGYTQPHEWVRTAVHIRIFSQVASAVDEAFSDGSLYNRARISSGEANGVLWSGANNDNMTNAAGGSIVGFQNGVVMSGGSGQVLDNSGSITGTSFYGVSFETTGTGDVLNNHGHIVGLDAGVFAQSFNFGPALNNFGSITSTGGTGIFVFTVAATTTMIDNAAGGLISGAVNAINGHQGRFHLVNHGTIAGNVVDSDNQNDVIVNAGKLIGAVLLGAGNDSFDGAGGTSGAIFAQGGNDRIVLGNGNAKVHVGAGSDSITAGPGADRFIFDSALASQVERINGFKPGSDRIVLSESDFAGIGPVGHPLAPAEFHIGAAAARAVQHIIYNPNTGFLFYDPDGPGGTPQTHFATLGAHLALHSTDFLVAA
jgi:Ca2+-binding RTX toxin-like protein